MDCFFLNMDESYRGTPIFQETPIFKDDFSLKHDNNMMIGDLWHKHKISSARTLPMKHRC